MSIGSYPAGSSVRLKGSFYNASDALTDPTTVSLTVKDPAGTSTTYTYALAQLTKSATGIYYRDVTMATAGKWLYRFAGTGSCIAVAVQGVNIETDPIG